MNLNAPDILDTQKLASPVSMKRLGCNKSNSIMTEKELKNEIIKQLHEGHTKLELYEHYKDTTKDETLRKILTSRPSAELRQKFKTTHLLLSIVWGIFILLELLGIIDLFVNFDIKFLFSLVISIYITIHLWNFDGRFLVPGMLWFAFTIFNVFREVDADYIPDAEYGFVLLVSGIYTIILLTGMYLMFYLKKHVFGYYKWQQTFFSTDDVIKFE